MPGEAWSGRAASGGSPDRGAWPPVRWRGLPAVL